MSEKKLLWHDVQSKILMLLMILFNAFVAIRSLVELFFVEESRLAIAKVPGLAAVEIVRDVILLYLCWHCWEARHALIHREKNALHELHDVYVFDMALIVAYTIALNLVLQNGPTAYETELIELIELALYLVLLFVNDRYYKGKESMFAGEE